MSVAKLFPLDAGQDVVRLRLWKAGWQVLNDDEVFMSQGRPVTVSASWCTGTISPVFTIAPVVPVCKGNTGPQV